MWHLRANLLERLRYEGHHVEVVCLDHNEQVKDEFAAARKSVKQECYNQVAAAKLLNKSELAALERQEFISPEDQIAIEKTQIADFYCQENVTPELVADDNDGKRRAQIVELEVLLQGAEISTKRDLDALERQLKWGQGVLTHVVDELKLFDAWTPQQKRQLWQVVPQWLKAKIRSFIDGLKGHADTLLPQSD